MIQPNLVNKLYISITCLPKPITPKNIVCDCPMSIIQPSLGFKQTNLVQKSGPALDPTVTPSIIHNLTRNLFTKISSIIIISPSFTQKYLSCQSSLIFNNTISHNLVIFYLALGTS